tara:strand:+ start:1889 stop:2602 length:714 start_codon:yes stop_codon:yes gene_type:complete
MSTNFNITREEIFTKLIYVTNLGQITPKEEMRLAETIGKVKKPINQRQEELAKKFNVEAEGVMHVTKGALFGHKETLDWHANKPSDKDRASLVWIYAAKGSEGSITSWIDNKKAYEDLPEDIKKQCSKIKFTCGFKKGGYTDDPTFFEHHNKELSYDLVYTNEYGQVGLFFPFNQIMDGIPKDLFEYLKTHILQDKYRYDHHWKDGDLVLSEQWLTIHKRHAFERMDKRLMHRITIE